MYFTSWEYYWRLVSSRPLVNLVSATPSKKLKFILKMNFNFLAYHWRLVSSRPLVNLVSATPSKKLKFILKMNFNLIILLEVGFIQTLGEFGIHPPRKKKLKFILKMNFNFLAYHWRLVSSRPLVNLVSTPSKKLKFILKNEL